MQIKLYQIIIFICVIVTATVIIFPDQHFIATELINSGRLETARFYIKRYTTNNPDDTLLFIMSSNTYLIEGMPKKAIEELKPFLVQEKVSKNILLRLVQLYEWEREPQYALKALERTSEIFPDDISIWNRLINYYRYLGQTDNEINAIISLARLNHNQSKTETLLSIIDQKMVDISDEHVKTADPMSGYLLSKLHVVRSNYADDIADPGITAQKQKDLSEYTMMRMIELYVYADLIYDIKQFVKKLDQRLKTGLKYRIALMNVLRWVNMDDDAIVYLWEIQKDEPHQIEILDHIVTVSLENGRSEDAIAALKQLIQSDPDNENYSQKLATLYVQSEDYTEAYSLYQRLETRFPDKGYAPLLIQTALNSNQKDLVFDAIRRVKDIQDKPPELLKQLVEIYLFQEQPLQAFDYGMQYVITLTTPNREYVEKLLHMAVWANHARGIEQAVALVQQQFPEDSALIIQSGDAYLAMEKPEKAFMLYGSIIHAMKEDRDFLIKYMKTASYTQSPEIMISAALTTSKLRTQDYKVIHQCIQLFQWSNQMVQAYSFFEHWFLRYGRTAAQVQQLLKLAQETGDPILVKQAVQISKRAMPKNPEILMAIAEQSVASGLIDEAIYAYEAYLTQKKDNATIQRRLAELYVWSGQHETAFQMYQHLHERFPDDSAIRDKMIDIASWTKNAAATAFLVTELAEASPSIYTLQIKAGDAWIAAGQTEKSISFFEQALQIKPDNIALLRKLSQYYGWLERYDDIFRVLQKIEHYGKLSNTDRIQLAQAAMDRKKPQKVITLLSALTNDQLQDSSGILLAAAYEQTGQKDKAISIYKVLAQKYPDNPEILIDIGNQLLWMKQLDTALSFYEQALSNDSNQLAALKGCAQIYAWQNNSDKAIRYFKRYVQINPDDYEVLYQLGELLFSNGQKRYAFKHYQKALALIHRAKKDSL
ncbi:MAG: tetratricopeptide repeat protein [Candidatus Magnetomorum sp.]|nr:tetratricopeptide repeat protein [Candidatus Magnetomorum sp.]